jgi:hypothetical protein
MLMPAGSMPCTRASWLGFFEIFVEIRFGSNVVVVVVPVVPVLVLLPVLELPVVEVDAVVVAGL